MDTNHDRRPDAENDNDGALAAGDFTDELSAGQVEADDESGSTDGTEPGLDSQPRSRER